MADDTRLPAQTPSPADERLRELRRLLPEAFVEGKLDVEKLRAAVGDDNLASGRERYGLGWAGKSDAVRTLLAPGTGTLLPCPAESVNFDSTENLIIEGDNLEVLKLLQKGYHGKVKLIYLDPPYNTGNDFIYADDFRAPLAAYRRYTGEIDEAGNATTSNRDSSGRFHSNWLNMMYPRLHLARNLLREDGVIFVSIDDNEVHNLRMVMNEVFGEENFVVCVIWKKRSTPPNDKIIGANHEYLLCFVKHTEQAGLHLKVRTAEQLARYSNPDQHAKGPWAPGDLMANVKGGRYVASLHFPIVNPNTGEQHFPGQEGNWRFSKETVDRLLANNEIYFGQDGKGRPKLKRFLEDVKKGITWPSLWDEAPLNTEGSMEMQDIFGSITAFENPKPVGLISDVLAVGAANDDLILDFFGGSGTTAHAVLDMNEADGGNRKFILVQLPEKTDKPDYPTIAHITRERVRRVIQRMEQQRAGKAAGADLITEEKGPGQALGFRALRLADSNFRTWDPDSVSAEPAELAKQLELHADNLVADRNDLDRLFELMLRAGLPLSASLSPMDVAGQPAWMICDGELTHVFCLASPIHAATLDAIRAAAPATVVCLDAAFAGDDALKTNTVLQMKDAGIRFHTA